MDLVELSNFAAGAQQQAISTLDGISEAVGGMNVLTFRLASDEELEEAGLAATQEDDEDDPFPPLRFVGNAFGPAGSTHTGLVRRLPNGYRHWTFTIRSVPRSPCYARNAQPFQELDNRDL